MAVTSPVARRHTVLAASGVDRQRDLSRYLVVFTMCAGAAVGAKLSEFVVAPVIGLAALCVACGLAVFRFGSPD
jgi:hypothetical protein